MLVSGPTVWFIARSFRARNDALFSSDQISKDDWVVNQFTCQVMEGFSAAVTILAVAWMLVQFYQNRKRRVPSDQIK